MKQVYCSPKSGIISSVIGNFDNPLPIRTFRLATLVFFLLGMAVAHLETTSTTGTLP